MPCALTGTDRVEDKATLSRTTLARTTISERDSLRVLALLENPPAANDRLAPPQGPASRCRSPRPPMQARCRFPS
jgi:hypothetical protein